MHAATARVRPISERMRAVALFACAAACCGLVAWTLLAPDRPFLWRVQQEAAWQGALEAALLWALGCAALRLPRSWPVLVRAAALLAPCALYLRRHHVDLPFALVLVYVEGIVLLGALLVRRTYAAVHDDGWLRRFVAGIALLSLALWLAQLAGYGVPRTQRLLAAAVLLPLVAWRWRELISLALLRSLLDPARTGAEARWGMLTLTLLLVLFARTNDTIDHDSMWYAFRPEQVLIGERSLFEPLWLTSPVYYFPKLYEVLLLPLAPSRDFSAMQGLTILCGALLARLCYALLRRLDVPRALALAGATTAWTIPALANATLTAKPDVLAALLVVALVWFALNVLEGRRGDLYWVFGCAALACSAKLLAFAYVGGAGLVCLVALWLRGARPAAAAAPADRWTFAVITAVALLVAARTWWLTGMPTVGPEQLVTLWKALGMQLQPPVGTMVWTDPQQWRDVPSLVVGWLFDPGRFSHLQITWPGHVWAFLLLFAALLPRAAHGLQAAPAWVLWSVPGCGLALLLLVRFMNEGSDGNYFIAPVALATVGALALVSRRGGAAMQRALPAALATFVVFHAAYGFVSASWSLGTRKFDTEFARTTRDTPMRLDANLQARGLQGVAAYLRAHGSGMRVVGTTAGFEGLQLPARFEGLGELMDSHRGRLRSVEDLRALMGCGRIDALLMPANGHTEEQRKGLGPIAPWAEGLPAEDELYRDADWRLVAADTAVLPCARMPLP